MATVVSPDLAGALRISVRTDDFRMRMWEPFRVVFVAALALHELFFLANGFNDPLSLGMVVPLMVFGLSLAGVAAVCWSFRFEIGPDGIRGVDFWRGRHGLRWDEMSAVRRVNLLGMPYLRITSRSNRPLWIPLFVTEFAEFEESLQQHVPAEQPAASLLTAIG
jgi:hypothetical protein